MTRVILIHRWGGTPETDWYPWLKREIEARKGECIIPAMPDSEHPQIEPWVSTLHSTVKRVNEKTYFVGHSVGCQTILRYIEKLPKDAEVGGVLLVAPWTKLKAQSYESESDKLVAKPWIETPIDWKKIFAHDHNTTCVFSEDDPYVSLDEVEFFRNKLNADIILDGNMGHFTIYDKVTELPMVLHVLEKWGIFPNRDKERETKGISKG